MIWFWSGHIGNDLSHNGVTVTPADLYLFSRDKHRWAKERFMSSEGFYIYLMRIGHKKDFMLCIESIVVSFLVLASSRLRLYPSEVIIHAISLYCSKVN